MQGVQESMQLRQLHLCFPKTHLCGSLKCVRAAGLHSPADLPQHGHTSLTGSTCFEASSRQVASGQMQLEAPRCTPPQFTVATPPISCHSWKCLHYVEPLFSQQLLCGPINWLPWPFLHLCQTGKAQLPGPGCDVSLSITPGNQ